jgi:hypothetical protein
MATDLTILCGDPTCESSGCSQEAIDAWNAARQEDARIIVRHILMGIPVGGDESKGADSDG